MNLENKLSRTEKEDLYLALMFNKHFDYIETICDYYQIDYNNRLINQILDKYSYMKSQDKVSKEQAQELVFINFLKDVKYQSKKRYKYG